MCKPHRWRLTESESMSATAKLLWDLSAPQCVYSHERDRHHLEQCLLPPSCCLSVNPAGHAEGMHSPVNNGLHLDCCKL